MVTNAGGGYSRWNDTMMTRWREDSTRDCWGTFFYLRDVNSGAVWSPTHQPTLEEKPGSEAIFSQARAEFRARVDEIDTHLEITVSPENDVEVRRITFTNHSNETRTIEVTSCAEIVLNTAAAEPRTPPSATCSSRHRSFPRRTPSFVHAARAHRMKNRRGSPICCWSMAGKLEKLHLKPTGEKFIDRGETIALPAAFAEFIATVKQPGFGA
ncbi:MAG: hypothetical protein WDN00_18835 [Limisphaerales bacterium]